MEADKLLEICRGKKVAFLDNDSWLTDELEVVGKYLTEKGVYFTAICNVENLGFYESKI